MMKIYIADIYPIVCIQIWRTTLDEHEKIARARLAAIQVQIGQITNTIVTNNSLQILKLLLNIYVKITRPV